MTQRTLVDIDTTSMSIVVGDPPNIEAIKAVFPIVASRFQRGIYFCYGDTIYNPCGRPIEKQLIAHEAIHALQTRDAGGPEKWWEIYLTNQERRFEFEVEAHRVEYASIIADGYARPIRRRYLAFCAERLAGPLYGNMVGKAAAKKLITSTEG